jgi:phospholipid-binding lipoprotein MlaA
VRSHAATFAAALFLAASLGACFTPPPGPDGVVNLDPYERTNRGVFRFNLAVDDYALGPVSRGWTFVTFEGMRHAVRRLFKHLEFPRRLLSNLGQGEIRRSGQEVGRFVVNTVVGVAGLFDPATGVGLADTRQDFGLMFARWRIGSGPYWMLPLFGPSNPRDAAGFVFDTALDFAILLPFAGTLEIVNTRAVFADDLEVARESALDYYVSVRNAYIQRRDAQIRGEDVPDAPPGAAGDGPLEDGFDYDDPNAHP